MKQPTWMIVAAALMLCGAPAWGANIFVNGNFGGGTSGTWAPGAATGGGNAVPTGWLGFATANQALRVSGNAIIFNAGNQPPINWIQQTVPTVAGQWYAIQWDHQDGPGSYPQRAVSTVNAWNGPTAAGAPDLGDRWSAYPTANLQQVFQAGSGQATVRFSDEGSNSSSNDTKMDNVSADLADGSINIAPSLGVASSLSHHGSFGTDPQQAVDGSSNYSDGRTNFHSGGTNDEWWRLDFTDLVRLSRVEIQARSGYNHRNGEFIDFINPDGNVIETLSIADAALWSADGNWIVSAIEIRNGPNASQALNLAEVRAFGEFKDGQLIVPEPATMALCALGIAGLARYTRRRRKA